jgi:acetoacetyl-CoA synthetase
MTSNNNKYIESYFSKFENIWSQGDYAQITNNNGLIIYGRSDATLNPGGIRIGTC